MTHRSLSSSWRVRSAGALALLLAVGCTSSPATQERGATEGRTPPGGSATRPAPGGGPGCRPPVAVHRAPNGSPELRAEGSGGVRTWGLVFGGQEAVARAGKDAVKIVWRVTGEGPLRVRITGPDGAHRPLAWGPTAHGSSTYNRPGDEWGTGIHFAAPGCWKVRLERDGGGADIWLRIGAAGAGGAARPGPVDGDVSGRR